MHEAEWLSSTDPVAMLEHLRWYTDHNFPQKPSERKLRLFACACCRQVWPLLTDARSRRAVEMAERYVDSVPSGKGAAELRRACLSADDGIGHCVRSLHTEPQIAADNAAHYTRNHCGFTPAVQAHLLRCIVGNPWRPFPLTPCTRCDGDGHAHGSDRPFDWSGPGTYPGPCPVCKGAKYQELAPLLAWNGGTVPKLARAIYDNHWFGGPCPVCNIEQDPTSESGLSPAEAQAAYDAAPDVPLSEERIQEIVRFATQNRPPCPVCSDSGRAPNRLPELADALEEAGCHEEGILRHLRGWVRCWQGGMGSGHVSCRKDCPVCHGKGWLPAGPLCGRCGGKGKIHWSLKSGEPTLDCGDCAGTGRLPWSSCRGDWVVDLLTGRA